MGFGGVQGMITTLKNNKLQKSERKKLFDQKEIGWDRIYAPCRIIKRRPTTSESSLCKRCKRSLNVNVTGLVLSGQSIS